MNNDVTYSTVFSKELKEAIELYKKQQDVNTLQVLEYYYQLTTSDYADCSELALSKCIQQRIDFSSTSTTTGHILQKHVKICCPECDTMMDYTHGQYECGFCKVVITLDLNAIHFSFFEQYWDRIETSKPYINSNKNLEIQIKGFRNNSSKGELLSRVIKNKSPDGNVHVRIAYEWIVQNKLIKKTIEEVVEKINSLDIE